MRQTKDRTAMGLMAAAAIAVAAGGAQAGIYSYDDGTADHDVGFGTASTLAWLQWYDVQPGMETITHVSTAFGTSTFPGYAPPVGTPFGVGLWSDPNGDGDPIDGSLLSWATDTIAAGIPDSNILQSVDIPDLTFGLSERFFLVAWVENSGFPAPLDTSQASNGRAWITGEIGATFDPNGFSSAFGWVEGDQLNPAGVFLLRANGVPTPGTLALLGFGAAAGVGRRRCKD